MVIKFQCSFVIYRPKVLFAFAIFSLIYTRETPELDLKLKYPEQEINEITVQQLELYITVVHSDAGAALVAHVRYIFCNSTTLQYIHGQYCIYQVAIFKQTKQSIYYPGQLVKIFTSHITLNVEWLVVVYVHLGVL